jgi:hypothetical protein
MYKPTDREQQRYLQYDGANPVPAFMRLFGTYGAAAAGLQERNERVVRVNAQSLDKLRAAVCLTPGSRSVHVRANITKARASTLNDQSKKQ